MPDKYEYRQFLGDTIESFVGSSLDGEGKGLYSLNTKSLEKLYKALTREDPREVYRGMGFKDLE